MKFTIDGEPVAQGRPRFSTQGGFARAYDPKKSRDYKSYIKSIAQDNAYVHLLQNDLKVTLDVYKAIPNSWSNKKKEKAREGHLRPVTKPDCDNYAKIVLDACNKIIWNDDSQIVELVVRKWYSDNPRIEVEVECVG
jgi:Holliday junction resolvase RusA-like endonuclease